MPSLVALLSAGPAKSLSPGVDTTLAADVHALYKKLGKAALYKVTRLVGRPDVAEEILQEVFLRLWQKPRRFNDERQAFFWVYKSCHNAGVDYLRSPRCRRECPPDPDWFAAIADERDQTARLEQRQEIAQALRQLTSRDARIFAYAVVDGMTQSEIAEILEISRKTVNRTMARLALDFPGLAKETLHES